MSSLREALTFSCSNCEAVISGHVTFFVGLPFCCPGCVVGGPCSCSYDAEPLTAHPAPPAVHDRAGTSLEVDAAFRGADERLVTEEPAVMEEPPATLVSARREGQLVRAG